MRTTYTWIACFLSVFSTARAFSFSATPTTECADLEVTWTGGHPPFSLGIFPVFAAQSWTNFSASTFSDGQGKAAIQHLLPKNKKFILAMSDASGFLSGGISEVLTVGPAVAGAPSCNSGNPQPQFLFDLKSALQQCRSYVFGHYVGAVQPVTIFGFVPGGQFLTLHPPTGPTDFKWPQVDIAAGTTVIFTVVDSQGRTGGMSDLLVVSLSNDATCLDSFAPSTTVQPTSSTSTSAPASSTPVAVPDTRPSSLSSSSRIGPAVGGAVGGLAVAIAVVVAILIFMRRRRRYRKTPMRIDLNEGLEGHELPSSYEPQPYLVANPTSYEAATVESRVSLLRPTLSDTEEGPVTGPSSHSSSTPSARPLPVKGRSIDASMEYQPARLIVHMDVEELAPDENGVIELPPSYSEGRRTLTELMSEIPPRALPPRALPFRALPSAPSSHDVHPP